MSRNNLICRLNDHKTHNTEVYQENVNLSDFRRNEVTEWTTNFILNLFLCWNHICGCFINHFVFNLNINNSIYHCVRVSSVFCVTEKDCMIIWYDSNYFIFNNVPNLNLWKTLSEFIFLQQKIHFILGLIFYDFVFVSYNFINQLII